MSELIILKIIIAFELFKALRVPTKNLNRKKNKK